MDMFFSGFTMKQLRAHIQNQAYAIVKTQWIGLLFLTLCCLFLGLKPAFSFLLGGLSALIPNGILVLFVFRRVQSQAMSQFVYRFAFAELFKLVSNTFLLLMVVKYLPISLSSTLAGFIGVIVLFWISGMMHLSLPGQAVNHQIVTEADAEHPLRRMV